MRERGGHLILSLLSVFALLVACSAAGAQSEKKVFLNGENNQISLRLRAIDRLFEQPMQAKGIALLVSQGWMPSCTGALFGAYLASPETDSWQEAMEECQRLIRDSGDALVPIGADPVGAKGFDSSLQVRIQCQARLAKMPPSLLSAYRRRVDPEADRLLAEGKATRSAEPLRRLVEEFFCSRAGDEALDLLGDLSFEQGELEEALRWWRLLAPFPSQQPFLLRYPDPRVDVVRIHAKQILTLSFLGDSTQALAALGDLRERHPRANGALAGVKGEYALTLQKLMSRPVGQAAGADDEVWTTFAGRAERNRAVSNDLSPRLWVDGPTWRVPVTDTTGTDAGDPAFPWLGSNAEMAVHPVIEDGQVIVADASVVAGYDLTTGKATFRFDAQKAGLLPVKVQPFTGARVTLTSQPGRVYAHLGRQTISPTNDGREEKAYLICLDTKPAGFPSDETDGNSRLIWKASAESNAFFEGSPVCLESGVYIAVSKLRSKRVVTAIACYDADKGSLKWSNDVCDTGEFEQTSVERLRPNLLTLAAGKLVYCSNSGAIVALDPRSGKTVWGLRYPSRGQFTSSGQNSPREVAPCIYCDRRLYVAPADTDAIVCLDCESGLPLWERKGVEVVHMLGIRDGRLIATTMEGITALDATTGESLWQQPGEGRLPPHGRGLLAGGKVFWPTLDRQLPLRCLSVADGSQSPLMDPTNLRAIPAGNFVFAQGCLVVAGAREMCCFVAPKLLYGSLSARVNTTPADVIELARSEADAGHSNEARTRLTALLSQIDPVEHDLHELVSVRLHEIMLEIAAKSDFNDAVDTLVAAAGRDFDANQRLEACERLARLWIAADKKDEAIRVWRQVLSDESMTSVRAEGTSFRSIRMLAMSHLSELLGRQMDAASQPPATELPKEAIVARANSANPPWRSLYELDDARLLQVERSNLIVDSFFVTRNRELIRIDSDGKEMWKQSLPCDCHWSACVADSIIVAGENGVVALRQSNGGVLWTFANLSRSYAALVDRNVAPYEVGPSLSDFRLVGSHLYFFVDARRLFALDVACGKIDWTLWAPGGELRLPNGGRFTHFYHVDESRLFVQCDGQGWIVDAQTGRVRNRIPGQEREWAQEPVACAGQRVAVGEPGGRVEIFDLTTARNTYRYAPDRVTSLSGMSAQIFSQGEVLVALVPRNYGFDVTRLDAARGKVLWRYEVNFHRLKNELPRVVLDGERDSFYYAFEGEVRAYSLSKGSELWRCPLGDSQADWQLSLRGQWVYAMEDPRSPPQAATLADHCLFIVSAESGHIAQRVMIPGSAPRFQLFGNRLFVGGGGGAVRALRSSPSE